MRVPEEQRGVKRGVRLLHWFIDGDLHGWDWSDEALEPGSETSLCLKPMTSNLKPLLPWKQDGANFIVDNDQLQYVWDIDYFPLAA